MRIPLAVNRNRFVIATIASLWAASCVAWLLLTQGEQVVAVRRNGATSYAVEWRIDDVVDWSSASATIKKSERIGVLHRVDVGVPSGPGWIMGLAASEWVFVGLPARDDGAADGEYVILRGPASLLTTASFEAVRKRSHEAMLPIMIAARRGDLSVNGRRGLIGLVKFKSLVLALYASAGEGWVQTPFEGAVPISDPDILEGLWRCVVSRQRVAESVRQAYNVGVHSNGDLGVIWDLFDKR